MMVVARRMNMAMGNFFFGGGTYIGDCNGEMQYLAGQRMIAVDGDRIVR